MSLIIAMVPHSQAGKNERYKEGMARSCNGEKGGLCAMEAAQTKIQGAIKVSFTPQVDLIYLHKPRWALLCAKYCRGPGKTG